MYTIVIGPLYYKRSHNFIKNTFFGILMSNFSIHMSINKDEMVIEISDDEEVVVKVEIF